MTKVIIINGPSLNLLGSRQPEIYGSRTMADALADLRRRYADMEVEYYQSNHEGDIIDRLQSVALAGDYLGCVLNAGAYTHTSLAIADAIAAVDMPVIEVHISNIFGRESVRHDSMISASCAGVIAGLGLDVYRLGVEALLEMKKICNCD